MAGFHKRKSSCSTGTTVIEIDLNSAAPGPDLLEAMIWPSDPSARLQAVASSEALVLDAVERVSETQIQAACEARLWEIAELRGRSPDELRSCPLTRRHLEQLDASLRLKFAGMAHNLPS
jgi:hypothetical protein